MSLVSLLHDSDSRKPRSKRGLPASFALGLLALLSVTAGCTAEQKCDPLTRCGGDLTTGSTVVEGVTLSEWVATEKDSCIISLLR